MEKGVTQRLERAFQMGATAGAKAEVGLSLGGLKDGKASVNGAEW